MAISELDAMSESLTEVSTLTVSSGSNRRAFLALIGASSTSATGRTSVTAGGVSMVLLAEGELAGKDTYAQLWSLTEAEIATMSGAALSYSGGSANLSRASVEWTVQDAQQTGETVAGGQGSGSTTLNLELVRAAASITFAVGTLDGDGFAHSTLSNPTQTGQFRPTGQSAAYGTAADTSNTSDTVFTGGAVRDIAMVLLNIGDAAPSGTTVSLDVDFEPPATYQTVQAMIATTNQTAGEGFGDPAISTTEDREVWACPLVVDGVNVTLNADLTVTVDSDTLITINAYKWSPSTQEWSLLQYTRGTAVPVEDPEITGASVANVLENTAFTGSYTITGREGETPTLSGADAGLFSIALDTGDVYDLSKDSNVGSAGTSYDVTIDIDNLVSDPVSLAVTVNAVAAYVDPDSTPGVHLGFTLGF